MKGELAVVLYLFFVCCVAEKQCSSYHYEEQTLAKVIRLEYRLEKLEDKVNSLGRKFPEETSFQCPKFWIRFKKSCYLFEENKYAFSQASSHCQRHGADLVHVNDFTENEFLQQHLKKMKSVTSWIGLEDTAEEGVFKWVDDNTSLSFTKWHPGQPSNAAGKQDCAHFFSSYNYNWNDAQCHHAYGSICEMKAKV